MPTKEDLLRAIDCPDACTHIANNFTIHAGLAAVARSVMRYELFQRVLNVHGSIIECGVKHGSGMFNWYRLSLLLEPHNYNRVVYGFDTFTGFPSVHPKDGGHHGVGEQSTMDGYAQYLAAWSQVVQMESPMFGHDESEALSPPRWRLICDVPRLQFVEGDFMRTGPDFISQVPSLVVALLYLDFDLYEPTKLAIELFMPRMPKGAIIAFDELNHPGWPGETVAAMEAVGVRNLQLRRFPFVPTVSYAVI